MNDFDEGVVVPEQIEETERPGDTGDRYYCRLCGALITTGGESAEVDGGHVHTFVNPSGYIFRIGCFRSAPGCRTYGEPTSEYTWFAGRSWSLAVCGRCAAHLGWTYDRGATREFFGLILDRLRREEVD